MAYVLLQRDFESKRVIIYWNEERAIFTCERRLATRYRSTGQAISALGRLLGWPHERPADSRAHSIHSGTRIVRLRAKKGGA
jgi:hypothetical protein